MMHLVKCYTLKLLGPLVEGYEYFTLVQGVNNGTTTAVNKHGVTLSCVARLAEPRGNATRFTP